MQQRVLQGLPLGTGPGVGGELFFPGPHQGEPALPEQVADVPEIRGCRANALHRGQQALHLVKGFPAVAHAVPAGVGKDHLPGQIPPCGQLQPVEGQHQFHLMPVQPGKAPVRLHADVIELPDARAQLQDLGGHGRGVMLHAGQQGLGMQAGAPPLQGGLGQIDDGQLLAQHVQVGPGALGFEDPGQLHVLQCLHRGAETGQIGPEHGHSQQEHHAPGQHQQGQIPAGRQGFVTDEAYHGKTLESSLPGKGPWRSRSVPPPGISR